MSLYKEREYMTRMCDLCQTDILIDEYTSKSEGEHCEICEKFLCPDCYTMFTYPLCYCNDCRDERRESLTDFLNMEERIKKIMWRYDGSTPLTLDNAYKIAFYDKHILPGMNIKKEEA